MIPPFKTFERVQISMIRHTHKRITNLPFDPLLHTFLLRLGLSLGPYSLRIFLRFIRYYFHPVHGVDLNLRFQKEKECDVSEHEGER